MLAKLSTPTFGWKLTSIDHNIQVKKQPRRRRRLHSAWFVPLLVVLHGNMLVCGC
eukprot:m.41003 g.41003  ORF g.41003 m.41003 type:complete len:55 (-) comp14069_c0_seq1:326-490(-)